MEITKVLPAMPQVFMNKEDAIVHFGYEGHKAMFQKLLKEFKENPEYEDGYRLPTSNFPILRIDLFDKFLKDREEQRLRGKVVKS
ncbi:hypothetical protein LABALGNA3A7_09440 [Dellaglioa algida]|nr:hypothetical protein LABALGNA3A7_09440 [Dellaglioa algida]